MHTFTANGGLDTTFNPNVVGGDVHSTVVQTDGKIILGVSFTAVAGQTRNRIARLNSDLNVVTQDGGLDTGFTPGTGANGTVNAIAVQSDGKIIIGGAFISVDGTTRHRIARLNSDGTLDSTFNPGTTLKPGVNGVVHSIVIQTNIVNDPNDDQVIIGGAFTTVGDDVRNSMARLNYNGSLDTGFDPNVAGVASPAVHSIALKLDKDGELDKIVVGGEFATVDGNPRNRVARLEEDGSLDSTLNQFQGPDATVRAVAIDAKGNIVIGGDFTTVNLAGRKRVARFSSAGTLDPNFQNGATDGANAPVYAIAPQSDGRVTIAGEFTLLNGLLNGNGNIRRRIGRLHADGSLDETFRPSPTTLLSQHGANGIISALAVQWDGLFVIGGDFTAYTVPRQDSEGDPLPPFSSGPRVARIGGH